MNIVPTQPSYDLSTREGCIGQIQHAWQLVEQGQRLSDEAMAAYLQLPDTSIDTLRDDLAAGGYEVSRKRLQNRQADLRKQGLLPPGRGGGRVAAAEVPPPEPTEEPTEEPAPVPPPDFARLIEGARQELIRFRAENERLSTELAEVRAGGVDLAAEVLELRERNAALEKLNDTFRQVSQLESGGQVKLRLGDHWFVVRHADEQFGTPVTPERAAAARGETHPNVAKAERLIKKAKSRKGFGREQLSLLDA